jgi:hypothetical protein
MNAAETFAFATASLVEENISFELQAFNESFSQWVRIGGFTGTTLTMARQLWHDAAARDRRHVRLILADAPEGANVFYGSKSANPVQAAEDAAALPR